MAVEPLEKKWGAWNWHVKTVDGHNIAEVRNAFLNAPAGSGRPYALLANTVKGKGISFMEDKHQWHYGKLTPEETQEALKELV
jgi:transketolase